MLTSQVTDLLDEFDIDDLKKIELYKGRLVNYDFSTITIKDYPIDIACEIFSRINTGGKPLTVFEIMVAKTYDESKKFDLAERYEVLRDGSDDEKQCLMFAKFETLPESLIMQCVAAITMRAVKGKDILKIKREAFIESWDPMVNSLFTAIDFVRTELRIPVSQLLPYPSLLIPFTYFFYKTGNKKASLTQARRLEQFFYWCGLNERYSSSSDSKINEDFNKVDKIICGESPTYPSLELTVTSEAISEVHFSSGNAYCKSILCLLAYNQPKSFDTDGIVVLDNSNLKISSSRNYHHFFPKNYLKKNVKDAKPNLIANITLIDVYSNKHKIGKKPPSQYISEFAEDNSQIDTVLKSHLIDDRVGYGIDDNNYANFVAKRSENIASKLNDKLGSV